METTHSKDKSKEQLIKEVRERLDWYNFQASEEEFDENEVAALVELLKVIDTSAAQVPDVDESYEKFKQYMNRKNEDAMLLNSLRGGKAVAAASGENAAMAENAEGAEAVEVAQDAEIAGMVENAGIVGMTKDVETAGIGTGRVDRSKTVRAKADEGKSRRGFMRRSYRYVAAAAALVLILVGGGAVGAVNAEKKGGVFQWLFKDDSGSVMLISPNDTLDIDYAEIVTYSSAEEVPEEYQRYLPMPNKMKHLDEYTLKEIEVREMEQHVWIIYKMENVKEEVLLTCVLYKNSVVVQDDKFNDYEYIDSVILQEQEMEIYSKVDDLGQIDYLVSFFQNSQQYYVQGKQTLEFLKQVALEYCSTLTK